MTNDQIKKQQTKQPMMPAAKTFSQIFTIKLPAFQQVLF
jgi:hypothetical protein